MPPTVLPTPNPKPNTTPLPRPYKDFLTPALHRRFIHAAAVVLALCWLQAVFLSRHTWFWTLSPIGPTTLRTLLLFIPCLAVFIIRLAGMHIGCLTITTPFDRVIYKTTSWNALVTLGWYIFGAYFFGEVYIWTRGREGNLAWVDYGNSYERPRVNENPMWLRCLYILLAFTQTSMHLALDYDRVPMEERSKEDVLPEQEDRARFRIPTSLLRLSKDLPQRLKSLGQIVVPTFVFSLPVYFGLGVRSLAWAWASWIAGQLVSDLPTNASPPGFVHAPLLLWQAFSSSLLLVSLWILSNAAFTEFIAEPPLKKGRPLTDEIHGNTLSRNKDPNGSLIRGLRAKKDVPKSYAFWELCVISHLWPERRKTFFTEVARDGISTWSQISQLCLDEIEAVSHRIKAAQAPARHEQEKALQEFEHKQQQQQQQQASSMPKIGDQTLVADRDILRNRGGGDLGRAVGNMAKSIGQSPGAANPLTPRARQALKYGMNQTISQDRQERWRKEGISHELGGWMMWILRQPGIGWVFQRTFSARTTAVLFSAPYSKKSDLEHATKSLVKLATCSLTEDDYGQVAKDIPRVVRTLTTIIIEIEQFVANLAPDWTDVEFGPRRSRGTAGELVEVPARDVPDVQEMLAVLKSGLEQILLAFGEYTGTLGLSMKEVREAREAVGQAGKEMVQRP